MQEVKLINLKRGLQRPLPLLTLLMVSIWGRKPFDDPDVLLASLPILVIGVKFAGNQKKFIRFRDEQRFQTT